MAIADGKKRVMLTLDVGVLERLDALCRERGQHRGHVVETILRRSLARLGKSPSKPLPDPRQLDIEDGLPPLPPAGESGTGAGTAAPGGDSRPASRAETRDAYLQDGRTQAAVERKFEIMGEALKHLHNDYPDLAERIPQLRRIVDFRNLLSHGYDRVIPERVWTYAERNLPTLQRTVQSLLADLARPQE